MLRPRVIGGLVAVVLLATLVVGAVTGQPVLLSYVETDSMSPTLEPGDGFVAVPAPVAGEPEAGDVVVYRAAKLQGGGLVTHRIVDRTDRGYITKGDGNPFTDQDGDEPVVEREQILATALRVNGEVLVIPAVGTVLGGMQEALLSGQRRLAVALGTRSLLGTSGIGYLLLGVGVLLLLLSRQGSGRTVRRERSRSRDRGGVYSPLVVALVLAALIVVPATGTMVQDRDSHSLTVVDADVNVSGTVGVDPGERLPVQYDVPNDAPVPSVIVLEPATAGVALDESTAVVSAGDTARVTATYDGPPRNGRIERSFSEYRYLPVLPAEAIVALHRADPLLALLAIDAVLGGAMLILTLALVGTDPIRVRSRDRPSRR